MTARRTGVLQKRGGKQQDKWQEVQCTVDERGLQWSSGSSLRDAAAGSQRTLAPEEISSVGYWSELGVEFGFEVVSTAKGGKVYTFTAHGLQERDGWVSTITRLIGDPESGAAASAAADDSEDASPVGGRMRVVKTAVLRSDVALDSPQVGELQRGDVIEVLETTEVWVDGVPVVRVRCAAGWTSVKSRAGNRMLLLDELAIFSRSSAEAGAEGFTLLSPSPQGRVGSASVSLDISDPERGDIVRVELKAKGCAGWFLIWIVLMVGMWVNVRCGWDDFECAD